MAKRKFEKEFLKGILWDETSGAEKISDEITGQRRWSTDRWLVFRFEDKIYGVAYSHGSTESQEERPFEYDPDEIECQELEAVEKTIVVYEPVAD